MHIHSNLSPDAGLLGTSLSAGDVYRAARGETVMSNTGQPFRLSDLSISSCLPTMPRRWGLPR